MRFLYKKRRHYEPNKVVFVNATAATFVEMKRCKDRQDCEWGLLPNEMAWHRLYTN